MPPTPPIPSQRHPDITVTHLQAENERLKAFLDKYKKANASLRDDLAQAIRAGEMEKEGRLDAEMKARGLRKMLRVAVDKRKVEMRVEGMRKGNAMWKGNGQNRKSVEKSMKMAYKKFKGNGKGKEMEKSSFEKLPNEIILLIAAQLGPSTGLASLCRVNKDMNALLKFELYRLVAKEPGNDGLVQAALDGSHRRVDLLLEFGAKIDALGKSQSLCNLNPILAAVRRRNTRMVKFLAEWGANLEVVALDGYTPLRHAIGQTSDLDRESQEAQRRKLDTICTLLDCGADIKLLTFRPRLDKAYPKTYLQIAMDIASIKVLPLLIRYGADVNEVLPNGLTPLQYCASRVYRSDLALIKILVENGADIGARCRDGKKAHNHYLDKIGRAGRHPQQGYDFSVLPEIVSLLTGGAISLPPWPTNG